jgi:prolyl oligopeptidase
MYLTYKKGLDTTKPHPVLLYGYGGFGISMTPSQSYENILLFNNNAILAVPLIRGGGELGSGWHEDGMRLNKQNSYDDFIAAAEYLISNNITTSNLLAIRGASNGGLLIGAMLTQRPDLFKVAIAQVGVYDMLRYEYFTGLRYLKYEYGSVQDSIDYLNLKSYSPLQNLKDSVDYPATLVITSENDDRVPPFHSYKFLATLQQKSSGSNPHILYYQEKAGHYGSQTFDGRVDKEAFIIAFMFKQMGIKIKH